MQEDRYKILTSVHVLFLLEEKVLLLLRKNISNDGLYSLVAGHLEDSETVTEAIIREVKEEVGLNLNAKDFDIKTVCHSYSDHNKKEFIQFYAVCTKWNGEIVNMEPEKCGNLEFFPINELPENMVPYIKDAIEKTLSGVRYYEYGWNDKKIQF